MLTLATKFDLTGTLGDDVRRQVGALVRETTEEVAADYKGRIIDNTGKTGRYYRRGDTYARVKSDGARAGLLRGMGLEETEPGKFVNGSTLHRASAPGQAPATDTGDLAASIEVNTDHAESDLYGDIINPAVQALVLEVGGDKVAARPALAPALQDAEPRFAGGIQSIMEGVGR